MMRAARSWHYERRYRRSDGSEFLGRLNGRSMFDAQGKKIGLLTVLIDISDSKRQEQKLVTGRQRLQPRPRRHRHHRPRREHPGSQRLLHPINGCERDEVIGKNPHLLHSGRQVCALYQAMWETLRQQDYWSGELWNRRKNGELYPELLTITAMRDEQQQISRYFGLFADISAMKETESKRESMRCITMCSRVCPTVPCSPTGCVTPCSTPNATPNYCR